MAIFYRKYMPVLLVVLILGRSLLAQNIQPLNRDFAIKGFHLDLRIQVMKIKALKDFVWKLRKSGINTLIMEWEASYPFSKHPLIPNRYAYSQEEILSFMNYCAEVGMEVIPLQQSFGHVDYILRHYRYSQLREDPVDYSQVCPSRPDSNKALFTDLFTELAATHHSRYFHIGGDETYLLGHCPICKKKAAAEGISKLYIDHIKMLCGIVLKLGKRPVLWADIALKYPEALSLLPKETIFIDWNYGWEMDRFGNHQKLLNSGFEIWGAPAMRSHPDNYFITLWEKHFNNIRDFVPACRKMGYSGIIMTAWSTSGQYDALHETSTDVIDLYAIRHVYPLTGFSMLVAAYVESLQSPLPLNVGGFIGKYCHENYGFNQGQAMAFWKALITAPFEVEQGQVLSPVVFSVKDLLDSARVAAETLSLLQPDKNRDEFDHYRLMADIRVQYLAFEELEKRVNATSLNQTRLLAILEELKALTEHADELDQRFLLLNQNNYYASELEQENRLRNIKTRLLYERLSKR